MMAELETDIVLSKTRCAGEGVREKSDLGYEFFFYRRAASAFAVTDYLGEIHNGDEPHTSIKKFVASVSLRKIFRMSDS